MAKTVHVVPFEKGWAVKRLGSRKRSVFFSTRKDAVARARLIVKKSASGQIAVHSRTGRIIVSEVHGLPRIQKSPVKSSLGSRQIERAVSNLVRERLAAI